MEQNSLEKLINEINTENNYLKEQIKKQNLELKKLEIEIKEKKKYIEENNSN